MSDYTPTTEEVRMAYGDARCVDPDAPAHSRGCPQAEEFDQWLAEHDRQVKAEALEAAADAARRLIANKQGGFSHWLRDRASKIREGRA